MSRVTLLIMLLMKGLPATEYANTMQYMALSPVTAGAGGAAVALFSSYGSIFINPASSAASEGMLLEGLYSEPFGLSTLSYLAFSMPGSESERYGVHLVYHLTDDIPVRPDLRNLMISDRLDSVKNLDRRGYPTFAAVVATVNLNWSRIIRYTLDPGWMYDAVPLTIPLGINIKYLLKDLHRTSGHGIGFDIGWGIRFALTDVLNLRGLGDLSFGWHLSDFMGTYLFWTNRRQEQLAMSLRHGFAYEQSLPWGLQLVATSDVLKDRQSRLWGIQLSRTEWGVVRMGYRFQQWTFGFSIPLTVGNRTVSIDYAFNGQDMGRTHIAGFRLGW